MMNTATDELHEAANTWILHNLPDDNAEFVELIERLRQIDNRLAMDLEDAGNSRVSEAMQNGFRLGWDCRENPGRLLFNV